MHVFSVFSRVSDVLKNTLPQPAEQAPLHKEEV